MQWSFRQLIDILLLTSLSGLGVAAWETGMGWMRVDQNGVAVPMEHQEDCEAHDWMGIPPPPNISMIKYNSKMVDGMNCDFETPDGCKWKIVPNKIVRKFGEDGLSRIEAHENNYGKNKDGTIRRRNRGHYLIFQANYKNAANSDCSPSFSHIESPWIEQSLPSCILQFNFTTTVHPDDYQETNEHAYMEVTLSDKSHGVIPLSPCLECNAPDDDKKNPWGILQYKIGKWNKFKFDIAFFRGINESKRSYFAIDDIQLINCLESPSSRPQQCDQQKEIKCNRTGKCVSKTMDLCDFHNDCVDKDDEENPICARMDEMGSQYRCDFAGGDCDWTTSGKMRWNLTQEYGSNGVTNYMDMNMADYFNKDLVTVGMLRSPEMPPPPLYNDDDTSKETFQSCAMRLYLRIEGPVLNVDMFEIEVVENIPFTKVSRGNRVKKKEMIKIKDFLRDNGLNNGNNKYKTGNSIQMTEWTKIELVIPTGMKYRYFIQLSAIKSPDISGRQNYRLGIKDISFSPQCLGLGVPENTTSGCKRADMQWSHDMDLKELAMCYDVPFPEEQTIGLDSFIFNSCGTNVGQYGPYKEECISYYESLGGNNTEVDMLDLATITSMGEEAEANSEMYLGLMMKNPPIGIQKWEAPVTGVFSIIVKGASGGHGRLSRKSSHGAMIKAIIKLRKGDILYILVGQEGESACVINGVEIREGLCSQMGFDDYRTKRWAESANQESEEDNVKKKGRRKERKRMRKLNSKILRSNYKGGGRLEAIHLINKLNQVPEKMLADESKVFQPYSQFAREKEPEEENAPYYSSQYLLDSDNVIVKEISETCTGDDCKDWMVKIKDFRPSYQGGGGGGGGGTFIFKVDENDPTRLVPLIIAGGGGGMADISSDNNPDATTIFDQDMMKLSEVVPDMDHNGITTETRHEVTHGGHGGGWNDTTSIDKVSQYDSKEHTSSGGSQHESWLGGLPCNYKVHDRDRRDFYEARWGGFGGGGGGCNGGGGGGGFIGGKGGMNGSENGEGGWSFVDKKFVIWHTITTGEHTGPGEVFIIPDISTSKNQSQCKCHDADSLCLALSEDVADVNCYCSSGHLVDVNIPCNEEIPVIFVIILVIGCIVLAAIIGLLCMCLYTQYQRKRMGMLRNKLPGANRFSNGIMMTEYNPNYDFAGGSCSLQDLREVDRENLKFVKALGQGAFGEVYQGIFKNKVDSTETAVAVKTLPELSTNQAEMDFLMEALIMSKFVHPNIVHFIGVCFDTHPRYIILELLAGGDLKTFLRESRSKIDKPSPLTMRDLLNAAIDVAKGCSYLEENHFIHRDIAARNCLLTSKGPDRIVKIADFGMARDIYRADYYRKGGKAMLPVKWMPPEAFLDGIFTAKTDIWSFGILLWEVMSLGYMPYPGRANQEVMQLVTNGGRLEPPNYCPGPLYGLMCQCWHPIPEERPTFTTILERLGYCLQDPEVVMAPLPVFHRPQSITSHDTSLSSLRTGECNSSGNSGSGGSVSIGPTASFKNNNNSSQPSTSEYLVPNLTSVTNLPPSPRTEALGFGITDHETSFTTPNSSSSVTRGAYTRVPTEPPTSTAVHSQCKSVHPRWNPQEFPNEGVQESKSTEPLLPSPTSGSLDLASIPPPCLYTDPVLPLNPARLAPSSYANVTRGSSAPQQVCDQRASLYAVTNRPYDSNNQRVESKTYPSNEISV